MGAAASCLSVLMQTKYPFVPKPPQKCPKTPKLPPNYPQNVSHTKNYVKRRFPITDELNDFLKRLKERNEVYFPNSNFLFPTNNELGTITNRAVYDVYVKLCKKLDIPRIKGIICGPHSFRRNIITFITNATNGNIQMAASLCGNHTEVAQKNYYTGPDLESSKNILDMRNKVKIS